ncbi:MAG TPA: 50S ribosomal protein L15 [Candidatus Cloacimonetes bacterium]|nr:50S ribosomal protein L15 [Candidatus Cloacimonadota bacterium]HEX37894.1 50S ribosomal protein L15 [Candidatus Cloacimonadota bacterium]
MKLNELKPPENTRHEKSRRGKGDGSGKGKTGGRGMNGQKCRSGASIPNWFEGGQMPIHRRLPMKGFNNTAFKKRYRIVSLNELADIDESIIDITMMEERGLIEPQNHKVKPVKVLANKENKFDKKKVIKANKFSRSAIKIIEEVGGKAEVV